MIAAVRELLVYLVRCVVLSSVLYWFPSFVLALFSSFALCAFLYFFIDVLCVVRYVFLYVFMSLFR